MKWKPVVPVIALVCAWLGTTTPLLAQAVQTSSLTGTIKDSTGAVLPGVTVSVLGPPTLEQTTKIKKQRSKDEAEFWHF